MSARTESPMGMLERTVKWVTLGLLAYWLLYSLVVPVTGWDSQTHDVARLLIAHHGGLFGNHGWNMAVQDYFPWGFDAVHYPFLFLGFGYVLPSFACFIGILVVIFRIVRESYGEAAAWWSCFSMLALPTLVYQATTTKNDCVMVFGVACWFYALRFWQSEKRPVFLALMALALGFTAGAKSSGLPLAAVLITFTCWRIGWDRRTLFQFAMYSALALFLMGSTESYIYNIKVYKHILGPPSDVTIYTNRNGLGGAAANAIRYFFGFMNVGVDVANPAPFCGWLADRCREVLHFTGLSNIGYFHNFNDANFYFMKDGVEASSDFGPLGMLALFGALWVVLTHPAKSVRWKLAAAGFLDLAVISYTIGWQPWCNRFLLLPIVLFTLAFILGIVGGGDTALYRRASKPLFLFLFFSAIAFPLYSYNRGPANIGLSLLHRDEMVAKERPGMLEIMKDIEALPGRAGPALLLLHANEGSWVLPILQIPLKVRGLEVMPAPVITPQILQAARAKAAARPVYILLLNRPFDFGSAGNFLPVRQYAEPNCSLVELQNSPPQ